MFREEFTAKFFDSFWRRIRKYGALGTGVTQNVSSVLDSPIGRDMLGNSEHLFLFNQSTPDRKRLADLLDISDAQLSYITNAESGTGLLRRSSVIIPFDGRISADTKIYSAMTTKIEEVAHVG